MQNYNTSISHTDIIPLFYLSSCNSFYILGLCSLASIQSQPRDRGLYQTHMCALLQLTDISSFVTVTKLARLSWEMCRLWLTAHVWILYFESGAALSNTASVKASLTLLSSTATVQSCRGLTALTTCLRIIVHSICVWSRAGMLSHTPLFTRVAVFVEAGSLVSGMFALLSPTGEMKLNTFMLAFWRNCHEREEILPNSWKNEFLLRLSQRNLDIQSTKAWYCSFECAVLMYVVSKENLLSLCHVIPTVLNTVFTTA